MLNLQQCREFQGHVGNSQVARNFGDLQALEPERAGLDPALD